jgi:hypothetical protein
MPHDGSSRCWRESLRPWYRAFRKAGCAARIENGRDVRLRESLHHVSLSNGQRLSWQEHEFRARVRRYVLDLRLAEAGVHRHHDGSGHQPAPECETPVESVAETYSYSTAARDSGLAQTAGNRGCAVPQFTIRDARRCDSIGLFVTFAIDTPETAAFGRPPAMPPLPLAPAGHLLDRRALKSLFVI